jgi:putative phosphoribosyl transferase
MSGISHQRITRRDAAVQREGVRLRCRLSVPEGAVAVPCAVFVHGLGSSKDSPRNVVVAERLLDAGIATLLFDLSGHGDSSHDPHDGQEAFVKDLEAVFRWAQAQPELDPERIAIAGSSLGAVIALEAAQRHGLSPAALVLRAPPIAGEQLVGVDVPALIIVGTQDLLLRDVIRAAAGRESVRVELVEGAGHLFEEPGTLERAVQLTADWLKRKLRA